jgi:hypothetical protein
MRKINHYKNLIQICCEFVCNYSFEAIFQPAFRYDSASIAKKIADEYGAHFKTNYEELSPSTVDERLRLLSEEVHRGLGSVNDYFKDASASSASESAASVASAAAASAASSIVASPSYQLVRPTDVEPLLAAADGASGEWTPIAGDYHTPHLPSDFELGFVQHRDYDHKGEPNRFVKTSVMYVDDGKTTGFVSTKKFQYEQSVTPTYDPTTTATMVVSSSGSYDSNASGSYHQEPDEEAKEVSARMGIFCWLV